MNPGKRLSPGASVFLICAGLFFDAMKIGLDLLFGIGLILDPFLITPIATLVFSITLSHSGIPMLSGKRGASGWINMIVSFIPGIDVLPDWTIYAIYMSVVSH